LAQRDFGRHRGLERYSKHHPALDGCQGSVDRKERLELATMPEAGLEELTGLYRAKGLSADTASQVARELAVAFIAVLIALGATVQSNATQSAAFRTAEVRPVCIRYGGREFIASPEMAGVFLRRAQQLIDDGDGQLVPLLDRDGIELLYVDSETAFSIHEALRAPWA
jgi:hypothetical protein